MAIGHDEKKALASGILRVLVDALPLSQCTVFAYEFDEAPRTISTADFRGGHFLRDVADTYTRHFYRLDGNRAIVAKPVAPGIRGSVLALQQSSVEITNDAYRQACYAQPNVSDRLSLLIQPSDHVWLSVNLYHDCAHGLFSARELECVESLAQLIAHTATTHYALAGLKHQDPASTMLARLRNICPSLSPRELGVLQGVLNGSTAAETAERMGIKATSVVTYQKRAYARLGICSHRQLFFLCFPH